MYDVENKVVNRYVVWMDHLLSVVHLTMHGYHLLAFDIHTHRFMG